MTSPTSWHADAQSRFHGIFEPELLENILSMGHHMLVPEGTMLMDVGQTMDAIPLLLEGAIKILRLDPNGDEILLYFLESGDSCALSPCGDGTRHLPRHGTLSARAGMDEDVRHLVVVCA